LEPKIREFGVDFRTREWGFRLQFWNGRLGNLRFDFGTREWGFQRSILEADMGILVSIRELLNVWISILEEEVALKNMVLFRKQQVFLVYFLTVRAVCLYLKIQ